MSFRPLQHLRPTESTTTGLPSRRFRLQGLATLLTAFSSANLADPVSDRQRSWGSPFGAFSSRRAPRHSCRADPPAVSFPGAHPPEGGGDPKRTGYWALFPPRGPCGWAGPLSPVAAGGSLGFCPSRGLSPSGLPRPSPRLLFRASRFGRRWPPEPRTP
jgi:hypothetical protein